MPVPNKLEQTILTIDEMEFTRLQQQAQQDKADLQAMFDAVDNSHKEQEA